MLIIEITPDLWDTKLPKKTLVFPVLYSEVLGVEEVARIITEALLVKIEGGDYGKSV
jgi:hypothetical protein